MDTAPVLGTLPLAERSVGPPPVLSALFIYGCIGLLLYSDLTLATGLNSDLIIGIALLATLEFVVELELWLSVLWLAELLLLLLLLLPVVTCPLLLLMQLMLLLFKY